MFGDLLEHWEALLEGRGSSPEQRRLAHRMATAMTKRAQQQDQPASGPPPVPGTPAHAQHRRKTLVKSLGMRMVKADPADKSPPPMPIPKGSIVGKTSKGKPIDLAGSKEESTFFENQLWIWEGCDCGCGGRNGSCPSKKKI